MSWTKPYELHESGDGDVHQVPRLRIKNIDAQINSKWLLDLNMMTLIRVLPMSLTKLDELHESGDGDTHQVPRLCTKSSCQDRTGTPSCEEIDIRLTRNDHFWPAAAPRTRPNPWTPKSKREPSSESFREKTKTHQPGTFSIWIPFRFPSVPLLWCGWSCNIHPVLSIKK